MSLSNRRVWNALALMALGFVLTMSMQRWVGAVTIYHPDNQAKRLMLHSAILANELPDGQSWSDFGAGTTNIRVLTVFIVEQTHRIAGASVEDVYELLDTLCIFLTFLALFAYLRKWLPDSDCLIAVLYYAGILSLTYFLHMFHPWDRLSVLSWVVLLWLLRENRLVLFVIGLPVAVAIKYDAVLLPGLYWLWKANRRDLGRVTLVTLSLFAASFAAYLILRRLFPGGYEHHGVPLLERTLTQVRRNLEVARTLHFGYPPLLVFGLPLILALRGFKSQPRFLQASVVFAVLLLLVFFLASNFVEVRAEMPVLVLLLPSALLGLRDLPGAIAHPAGAEQP